MQQSLHLETYVTKTTFKICNAQQKETATYEKYNIKRDEDVLRVDL